MADQPTRSPVPRGRTSRAVRWWLAAVTFVVGLIVGGIAVGLVGTDPPSFSDGVAADTATPPASSSPAATTSAGATAEVMVNDACLRALNAAQDIYGSVNDLARAAGDLDVARLDEVIRQLQPLQSRLLDNLNACEVQTRLPDGSVVSSAPSVSTGAAPTS